MAPAVEEVLEATESVEFLKFHKAVLSMVLKQNQELGHGLFLFKLQEDSISVVDLS